MHRYHHRITLPLIIFTLLVVLGILGIGMFNILNNKNTTVPRGSNMSVLGIELNQNINKVDLHQVQENGISFVYLRSTQGKTYFDDDYYLYRDQLKGTNLAYGSILTFSDESTPLEQYNFFNKKVGQYSGNLPIMIVPAEKNNGKKYWLKLAQLATYFQQSGRSVLVADNHQWQRLFSSQTQFLYTGASLKKRKDYSFWCYTQNGRVKNTDYLNRDVTMFAYLGSMASYQQLYNSNLAQ